MMRVFLLATALVVMGSACATSPRPHRATAAVNQYNRLALLAESGQSALVDSQLSTVSKTIAKWEPSDQALLLGALYYKLGRWSSAQPYFEKIASDPRYSDYARWYLSGIAFESHTMSRATNYLHLLLNESHNEAFKVAARERLAAIAVQQKNWSEALSHTQQLIADSALSEKERRRYRIEEAAIFSRDGKIGEASQRFRELYVSSTFPDEAALIRQRWMERHLNPFASWQNQALLDLADQFNRRRMGDESLSMLDLVKSHSLNAADQHRYSRLEAEAYFSNRDYNEATKRFRALTVGSDGGASAYWSRLATSLARAGENNAAIAIQKGFVSNRSVSRGEAASAQNKIAFLLMDSGKLSEALIEYEKWILMTSAKEEIRSGHWFAGWCAYRLQRYQQAAGHFEEIAAHEKKKGYWFERAEYWNARAFEKMGKTHEALAIYSRLARESTTGYYGHIAAERSRGQLVPFVMNRLTPSAPIGESIEKFRFDAVMATSSGIRLGVIDIAEVIFILGKEWGVDPRFVAAQMWQESRFDGNAVSQAHAVGLMQIIPPTARKLAKSLGWQKFQIEDLTHPSRNIILGMWYLRQLLDRYDGNMAETLAAYNAGEEAVDRWKATSTATDSEEFVEEIPYTETNQYVKKILGRFWTRNR